MVYVSSDWHGVSYEKIESLLDKANFGADDYLYILGDVIDRGEHGVELIKHIMNKPNIKLIRGNHEQMFLSCDFVLNEVTDKSINNINFENIRWLRIWQANGAGPTMAALANETPEMRQKILEYIRKTPLHDTVSLGDKKYLLVHAGLGEKTSGEINDIVESSGDDVLWTRPYLATRYSSDFTTVLGHTPTYFYGNEYKGKILKTDTWIDIDTGAAMGLMPSLLRLDDLKEFYLE